MKRSITCIALALALAWAPTASAGLFEDFFQASPPEILVEAEPAKTLPRIQVTNDINADYRLMEENGYIEIGRSVWRGRYEDPKKSIKKAKKIKAEVVLFTYQYLGSESGGSMYMPHPGSVPGGLAVPITFHTYDVAALYLSKIRPEKIGFGIVHRFMTPQEVQQIGTNKAAVVEFVRRGSAAFDADLLTGDVVLSIAGQDFSNKEKMDQVKTDYAGQTVPVELVRNGKRMTLPITVPNAPVVTPSKKAK
ncbi:PDZ domain-containing protein [Sphingorhabdus sp.]|uniref:PDZ domain-containing protein n=1 Tax=Sphingorhabdus sp. TaxID=1902408 RepID=UPI00404878F6